MVQVYPAAVLYTTVSVVDARSYAPQVPHDPAFEPLMEEPLEARWVMKTPRLYADECPNYNGIDLKPKSCPIHLRNKKSQEITAFEQADDHLRRQHYVKYIVATTPAVD